MTENNYITNKLTDMKNIKSNLRRLLNQLKLSASDLVLAQTEAELLRVLSFYIKSDINSDLKNIGIAKRYLAKNESNIMKSIFEHFDSHYHFDIQDTKRLNSSLEKLIKCKMILITLKPLTNEMLEPFHCAEIILRERGMKINFDKSIAINQILPDDFIVLATNYKKQLITYQKHKSELMHILSYASDIVDEPKTPHCCILTLWRKLCILLASSQVKQEKK